MNQYNYDREILPPQKPEKTNILLIVVVSVLIIAMIAAIGVLYVSLSGKNTNDFSNNHKVVTNTTAKSPFLAVTSCPEYSIQAQSSVVIEGVIASDVSSCQVDIDGEIVETTNGPGHQKVWRKTYNLTPGESRTFVITARDNNGNAISETRQVYCQKLVKVKKAPSSGAYFEYGRRLSRRNTSSVINIRSGPGTNFYKIDEMSDSDPYVWYTGYSETGSDGYLWHKVSTVYGNIGYVRSDIVK